jgi:hypothetical protein
MPVLAAKYKLGAAFLAGALALSPRVEGAMRCGTRIIARGDVADKLLQFCGEPSAVQRHLVRRTASLELGAFLPGFVEDVWVEDWTYNLGPYKLMRIVRLENGVVTDIRQLGYGY